MSQAVESLIVQLWPISADAPALEGEQLLTEVPPADPFDWVGPISETVTGGHALTLRVPSTIPEQHLRVEVRDVGDMHPINALMEPNLQASGYPSAGMFVVLATRNSLAQAWDEHQFEGECALVYKMAEIPPVEPAWSSTLLTSPSRGYVSADGRAVLIACEDFALDPLSGKPGGWSPAEVFSWALPEFVNALDQLNALDHDAAAILKSAGYLQTDHATHRTRELENLQMLRARLVVRGMQRRLNPPMAVSADVDSQIRTVFEPVLAEREAAIEDAADRAQAIVDAVLQRREEQAAKEKEEREKVRAFHQANLTAVGSIALAGAAITGLFAALASIPGGGTLFRPSWQAVGATFLVAIFLAAFAWLIVRIRAASTQFHGGTNWRQPHASLAWGSGIIALVLAAAGAVGRADGWVWLLAVTLATGLTVVLAVLAWPTGERTGDLS